jgi:hypothetical protein
MALLGGATVWSFAAHSQQRERIRRIGVLMGFSDDAQGQIRIAVLREELAKHGWTEGQNAHIEVRWGLDQIPRPMQSNSGSNPM